MRAFIWNRVEECTDNYHKEGAVLVIAVNLDRAREIGVFETYEYKDRQRIYLKKKMDLSKAPDHEFIAMPDAQEKVEVFPDAGCC